MLQTNLKHLETLKEIERFLEQNENTMLCCGRMGKMCIPVFARMQKLEKAYPHVAFCDVEFDIAAADYIKSLPECRTFRGLPFTVYFKDGKVVQATTSIQSEEQITQILDTQFGTVLSSDS